MKLKYIIYTSVLALSTMGCSDNFLNNYPKGKWHHGNYTPDNEIDNSVLSIAKLQEAYTQLRSYSFVFPVLAMHNYTTPDAEKGSTPSDGGSSVEFKPMSYTPSNSQINSFYSACFKTITKTNEAIALISAINNPETNKNELLGEALFLRATMYYRLVQAFGGVPLVTKVLGQTDKTPPRSSAEEIYQNIEKDLLFAIPNLPTRRDRVSSGNLGRATQNAARAVLAKSYLYQKRYNDVLSQTSAIIGSGDNDLSTPYHEIFTEDKEFGPESVFEVNVELRPADKINISSQWAQVQGVRGVPNLGWGFNGPSKLLMDAYESGDPRKKATVIANGDMLEETLVKADAAGYQFFNKKVYPLNAERAKYGRKDSDQGKWVNIRVIRYADILLMHAEAACELGMIDTEALPKLEMIRARARGGNADILPKIVEKNQTKLRDLIRNERRIELALEFERFYDLVRWNIAKDLITGFTTGKHELYPIPQKEIDNSGGILVQNPGY